MVVFENDVPIFLHVFPIGGADITNDIALGLKIPIEEAEEVKIGSYQMANYPHKKLDEIIEARLTDIFELVENYLKNRTEWSSAGWNYFNRRKRPALYY